MSEENEEEVFLTPEIDPFKNNPILNIKFSMNKGTDNDKKLIRYFYNKTVGEMHLENKIPSFQTTVSELMNLIGYVAEASNNVIEVSTVLCSSLLLISYI